LLQYFKFIKNESAIAKKKRVKCFCTFNDNWLKDDNFKSWLMKDSNEYTKCKICQIRFIVKYDGISAIKQHLNSLKHKNMNHNFFENKNTPLEK